jgi:protein-tyrosine-phosphatase
MAAALSAGTTPADRVHPEVVAVMLELGIDLAVRQRARPSFSRADGLLAAAIDAN